MGTLQKATVSTSRELLNIHTLDLLLELPEADGSYAVQLLHTVSIHEANKLIQVAKRLIQGAKRFTQEAKTLIHEANNFSRSKETH